MDIKARYLSRFWLVVLPSIIIILGVFGVPYGFYTQNYFGIKSGLLKLGMNVGGFVLLIVVTIALYPVYKWIARKQKGRLSLNGFTLSWKALFKKKSIDMTQGFSALVDSGPGIEVGPNTLISVQNKEHSINIGLAEMGRQTVMRLIDDENFVGKQSIPPEEGSGGFELNPRIGQHHEFAKSLVKLIWDQRDRNEAYAAFLKFPWNTKPRPSVARAMILEDKGETDNFTANAAVKVNDSIYLTADNILVRETDKKCSLMPVGFTRVSTISRPVGIGSTSGGIAFKEFWEFITIDGEKRETRVSVAKETSDKNGALVDLFMMRFVNSRCSDPNLE